jgi:phosphatidylserine decarboxylase
MRDQTFMTLVRLLPRAALSRAVGAMTRVPAPAGLHQLAMRRFARAYGVEMDESERPLEGYSTFSEFFSRGLKTGARPIDAGVGLVVSPVDGVVSEAGLIERGQCLQAKGLAFPVAELLGDQDAARPFVEGGTFATLYLSPRDYHRVHAPLGGTITGWRYLPGELWPVNPASVRTVRGLFALNERLVTWLETPAGRCAAVMVGATCVGRIHAAYDDVLTYAGKAAASRIFDVPVPLMKGDELGRFEMGSTVILLFAAGRVALDSAIQPGARVTVGRRIGEVR